MHVHICWWDGRGGMAAAAVWPSADDLAFGASRQQRQELCANHLQKKCNVIYFK